MIVKSFSLGTRMLMTSLICLLMITASFLLWVSEQPRSLPLLNSYIEYSFNRMGSNYKVSIEKTLVLWDSKERKFDIRSINMRLLTASDTVAAYFPEASLGFSVRTLINGSLAPRSLTILSPTLRFRTPTHPLMPEELKAVYNQRWKQVVTLMQEGKTLPFRSIILKNARLILDTPSVSMLWHVPDVSLTLQMEKNVPELSLKGTIDFTGEEARIEAHAELYEDNRAHLNLAVQSLPLHKLLKIIPFRPNVAPFLDHNNTNIVLTANAALTLTKEGVLEEGGFIVADAYGKVFHPDYMQEPLYPTALKARGTITEGGQKVIIDQASLHFQHDIAVSLSLTASGLFSGAPEYQIKTEVAHFPVDDLGSFWPVPFAPKARTWVTTRITGGMVSKAQGTFRFRPEYFATKSFPDDAIQASVHFSGSELDYFATLPPVQAISGVAMFDNNQITVTASHAMLKNTVLQKAVAQVPYINILGKSVKVEGVAKGGVEDLMAFIPAKKIGQRSMPLHLQAMTGEAETAVKLVIPYKPHVTLQDVDITAESILKNIRIPAVLPHIDASNGALTASLKARALRVHGAMQLNGNPSSLDTSISLRPEAQFASETRVNTVLLPKDAEAFGAYEGPKLAEGKVAAMFHIQHQPNLTRLTTEMDTKEAGILWDKFSVAKPVGQAGMLRFTTELRPQQGVTAPWVYSSDALSAKGDVRLSEDFSLRQLNVLQFVAEKNNFTLHYTVKEQGAAPVVVIKGSSIDLRQIDFKRLFKPSKKKEGLSLTVNMSRVLMKNDEVFTRFSGNLQCDKAFCTRAAMAADMGEHNSFALDITPVGEHSVLIVRSDNAAALARALNITKNIKRGTLRVSAILSRQPKGALLKGNVQVDDFVTTNNPILSQILGVITLPGIGLVNVLKGEGVAFDRLDAPFTFSDGIITVANARASGQLLSITSNGSINLDASTMRMSGIVTPTVYGINSLVSRIPLFGKALMGGKNQGVIAANYTLSGPINQAALTVNPLSIFTPGFLRKIFE